jgi:hypothetical protein
VTEKPMTPEQHYAMAQERISDLNLEGPSGPSQVLETQGWYMSMANLHLRAAEVGAKLRGLMVTQETPDTIDQVPEC